MSYITSSTLLFYKATINTQYKMLMLFHNNSVGTDIYQILAYNLFINE